MTLRSIVPLTLALVLASFGFVQACTLEPTDGGPTASAIGTLAPGTFAGHIDCDGVRHQVGVWTLLVDGKSETVGIRDEPLFQIEQANPLQAVARISYDRDVQFTLFRRARDPVERPHRLFATVCAIGSDPLDCSLGDRRIKIRIDLRDSNLDGILNRAYHQISIYDGADRLQVIFIDLPTGKHPHDLVGAWIRFFRQTGAVNLSNQL